MCSSEASFRLAQPRHNTTSSAQLYSPDEFAGLLVAAGPQLLPYGRCARARKTVLDCTRLRRRPPPRTSGGGFAHGAQQPKHNRVQGALDSFARLAVYLPASLSPGHWRWSRAAPSRHPVPFPSDPPAPRGAFGRAAMLIPPRRDDGHEYDPESDSHGRRSISCLVWPAPAIGRLPGRKFGRKRGVQPEMLGFFSSPRRQNNRKEVSHFQCPSFVTADAGEPATLHARRQMGCPSLHTSRQISLKL
jgi:hypothetical protein